MCRCACLTSPLLCTARLKKDIGLENDSSVLHFQVTLVEIAPSMNFSSPRGESHKKCLLRLSHTRRENEKDSDVKMYKMLYVIFRYFLRRLVPEKSSIVQVGIAWGRHSAECGRVIFFETTACQGRQKAFLQAFSDLEQLIFSIN